MLNKKLQVYGKEFEIQISLNMHCKSQGWNEEENLKRHGLLLCVKCMSIESRGTAGATLN